MPTPERLRALITAHPLKVWRFGRLSSESEPNLRISCL